IITGPNMGGKSTYMRQVALIVLLASMGSHVPAARCRLGPIDAIHTRIGAADDLANAQSTFMMEMTEAAQILHAATPHSLVLMEYLRRFRPELVPTEEELHNVRFEFDPAPPLETLMLHFCGEIRLNHWYRRASEWHTEPVIKAIYK
ncbi:hypothetical protein NQ024_13315, partial [Corynebacterium sp. 35RC1]|nr:hypothetical protein [Corynebacterium sp. 35RC1]